MGVRSNFSRGGGQRRHFAYPFSGYWPPNAYGRSQNALPFLHRRENSPWNDALYSHPFWNRIQVEFFSCLREDFSFLSSLTGFAELEYHPISLLLWTADNWIWIGLEPSTTAFAVLPLVCAGWTSAIRNVFLFVNYLISIFGARFYN